MSQSAIVGNCISWENWELTQANYLFWPLAVADRVGARLVFLPFHFKIIRRALFGYRRRTYRLLHRSGQRGKKYIYGVKKIYSVCIKKILFAAIFIFN